MAGGCGAPAVGTCWVCTLRETEGSEEAEAAFKNRYGEEAREEFD